MLNHLDWREIVTQLIFTQVMIGLLLIGGMAIICVAVYLFGVLLLVLSERRASGDRVAKTRLTVRPPGTSYRPAIDASPLSPARGKKFI